MKIFTPLLILIFIVVNISCNKDNDSETLKEYSISGNVQKGPFINGSNVFIYELDKHLKPTGRSFRTSTDEKGYFELKNIRLASNYVELLAEGFYFNEVIGDLSNEKLSLKSIINLATSSSINININVLTDLEYDRVKYLIETGLSFERSKAKAQNEILSIFDIKTVTIKNPESLDIVKTGEGDAALLAISTILQVNRTTSELSKLLADIVMDMKKDGILNDSSLIKTLATQSVAINVQQVKENLIKKYKEFGIDLQNFNDFSTYINNFIKKWGNIAESPFDFPVSTLTGQNILVQSFTNVATEKDYAFAVKMPKSGSIMVKIMLTDGTGIWFYQPMVVYGWIVSNYNAGIQTFTSILNGSTIDLPIRFTGTGMAKVEYYYNGSANPGFTKTLTWGAYNNSDFEFPRSSVGPNLLALGDSASVFIDSTYTIGLYNAAKYDVKFKLFHNNNVEVLVGYGDYSYTKVNDSELDFELKGEGSKSEIALKFTSGGQFSLSSDLQFKNGAYLGRTYFIKSKK